MADEIVMCECCDSEDIEVNGNHYKCKDCGYDWIE